MDEPGFFSKPLAGCRVAIWGMGLMGGSLAMALRGKCAALVGIDRDPAVTALAVERGVVEAASTCPEDVLPGAEVVILAVPVRAILDVLEQLPELCPRPVVVLDLGSTKTRVVEAMAGLPARFDPLGGHPMCGKETSSIFAADPAIFRQARFALVALERTSPFARRLAEEIALAVGSAPLWLDPSTHDRWAAATSHAPYLLAAALAVATPLEAAPLVGPGFRSTSRVAASAAKMMVDVLATNAGNVREALAAIKTELAALENLLKQGDDEALATRLEAGAAHLRSLTGQPGGEAANRAGGDR